MSSSTEIGNPVTGASAADVVDVIDRAALVENIINQVILGYCKPRKEAWEFMWNIVLDTSVMPLGGKIKVVMAIAHEMGFKLEKDALHRVIQLRNAFAHHASDAHPVVAVGQRAEEDTHHFQFWVLEGSGKITRIKRHEALDKFNASYRKARVSLVQLKDMICEKFGSGT